jgi:hypothetical protein
MLGLAGLLLGALLLARSGLSEYGPAPVATPHQASAAPAVATAIPAPPKRRRPPAMFGDFLGAGFGQFGGGFGQFGGGFGQFGGGFGQFGGGFGQFGGGFGQFGGGFGQFGEPAIPVARGALKIAENESPLPQNRAFVTFNYYSQANGFAQVNREMAGFEKTFLNERASFGMRQAFLQVNDTDLLNGSVTDDLSLIFKYAFLNDEQKGNFVTGGLTLTLPTGDEGFTPLGERIHPTLFQPYVGYVHAGDTFFVQGFTSILIPNDDRDVTVLFSDIGVGFWTAHRDTGWIRDIVPMLELHLNNPLNHRVSAFEPGFRTSLDVTGGARFMLDGGSSVGVALGTPITHPKTFEMEGIVQVNVRY